MTGFEHTNPQARSRWLLAIVMAMVAVLTFGVIALAGCSSESGSNTGGGGGEDAEGSFADLQPVTLILADNTSTGSAGNMWAQAIVKNVEEITGGKLKIDYHGTGELGGDADLMRQVQANDIQMVIAQPATMVNIVPGTAAFDLPMAFATYEPDEIEAVLNTENDFSVGLEESFNSSGLHNIAWLQNGTYRETTSNKDLSTLDGFKGFQIRTMENSNHMDFWTAIGAEPTPLAFSEVYFALQNGTVDGQENATDTSVGMSFQEVQKYLAYTNHILYANDLAINLDCWNSLAPAYQDAINEAVALASEEIRPQLTEFDETNKQTMLDAGMELIEYDDGFFEEILALPGVQQVYQNVDDQTNGLGTLLVEQLNAARNGTLTVVEESVTADM